jgi:hypothetical protein
MPLGLDFSYIGSRRCTQCRAVAKAWETFCPRCRARLDSPRSLRIRGAVIATIGAGIAGGIGYLTWLIVSIMRHSIDPGAKVRFNGTPAETALVLAILTAVIATGLVFLFAGLEQILYARRSRFGVKFAMVLFVLLLFGSFAVDIWDIWS